MKSMDCRNFRREQWELRRCAVCKNAMVTKTVTVEKIKGRDFRPGLANFFIMFGAERGT